MISLRWTFYVFTITVISILFISKYIKHTFKIKNEKTNKKIISIISLIIVLCGKFIFQNSSKFNKITYDKLPIFISIIMILIPFIITKKVKNKSLQHFIHNKSNSAHND